MSLFDAILVPLDGSAPAARSLGVASWLAARLGARLHLLSAGPAPAEGDTLAPLRVPEKYRRLVELHQVGGEAAEEIRAAIPRLGIDLLVMAGLGAGGAAESVIGHVACEVIEASDIPVLLLPSAYRESLPWRSLLVALSGEIAKDEALTLALRLAHALDLSVDIAHVCAGGETGGAQPNKAYADVSHHDLAERLNEMIAAACPLCSAEERRHIGSFHLARGDVAPELLHLIDERQASALVLGWHGRFMAGHAQALKSMLRQVRCPLLLVRPGRKPAFRLKVGEALGERRRGNRRAGQGS